jgi:hypothetical protein
MIGVLLKSSGFFLQNFLLSMALFFNRASGYGLTSQDFLPFFFGYERTFSFIGVRELVALLLGYERTFSFIGVCELVALLLGSLWLLPKLQGLLF